MNFIKPFSLTRIEDLQSLVEHRNRFSLDFCELNVFETHQHAEDFKLKFGGFAITSMLRGKKVMKLDGMDKFDYLPGQTVLAPRDTTMTIDFPEAHAKNPTQCTALVLDSSYLSGQLDRINELCSKDELSKEWRINHSELILDNNFALSSISERMLNVFSSDDPFKDYQVDTILRELVICLLRLQHLNLVRKESAHDSSSTPFHAVQRYITEQISSNIKIEDLCRVAGMSKSSFYRAFTEAYGISPVQLILEERIAYAKSLLLHPDVSVKETAYMSGFNNPNYFSRAFRKQEGLTPSQFREKKGISDLG